MRARQRRRLPRRLRARSLRPACHHAQHYVPPCNYKAYHVHGCVPVFPVFRTPRGLVENRAGDYQRAERSKLTSGDGRRYRSADNFKWELFGKKDCSFEEGGKGRRFLFSRERIRTGCRFLLSYPGSFIFSTNVILGISFFFRKFLLLHGRVLSL